MVKLRRLYEYWCFESDKNKEGLKKYLGDDLYNDYMKIREKLPKLSNQFPDFTKKFGALKDWNATQKNSLLNTYNKIIELLPKDKINKYPPLDITKVDSLSDNQLKDLLNTYMEVRPIVFDDQKKYRDFQELKKLPINDVEDFVSSYTSGRSKKQTAKIEGAEKLYEDPDWVVYRITKYPAAVEYGKGTKWCISGNYHRHESNGEWYFNDYIKKKNLDGGYYFCLNRHAPSRKYCILRTNNGNIDTIWDAKDSEIQDVDRSDAPNDLPLNIPYKGFDLGEEIQEYIEEYAGSNYDPVESLANELSKGPKDWDIDRIDNFVDMVGDYGLEDFDYYYEILCPRPPMSDDLVEAFEILLREYVPTIQFLETHSLGNACYNKLLRTIIKDPESYGEDYFDFVFNDMVSYYCEKEFPITKDKQVVLNILKNCSDDLINDFDSGCSISDIIHVFNNDILFSREFLPECFNHGLDVSEFMENNNSMKILKHCIELELLDLNDRNSLSDNSERRTIFMDILYNMNPSVEDVRWMLQHGADPNIKDRDGDTAVEYTDNPKIIELLS